MKVWQFALSSILIWRIALIVLALGAINIVPFVANFTPSGTLGSGLPYLAWIWGNFDGMIFMLIAQSGYSAEQLPFFPLLPLLLSFGERLGFPIIYTGLFISVVMFFVAQYFIYRLLSFDKQARSYWLVLLLMLAFPTSPFYTAIYADSLFLALATGSLYYARKQRWIISSVLASIATLARLNGLALVFMIATEYWLALNPKITNTWNWRALLEVLRQKLFGRKLLSSGILAIVAVPLAFLGYLAYIQIEFGNWHLFFSGVEVWHRSELTFPLQTFWRYFKILILYPDFNFAYVIAGLEAFFTGLYMLALFWSWGKIRLTYWVMIFFHLLIPVLTGTLQGMPRYGLHLLPLFMIYALWLQKRSLWVKTAWFAVSLGLMAFYVIYFTRGYFVA